METFFKFIGSSLQDETEYKETSERVKREVIEDSYSKEDLSVPEWKFLHDKGIIKPSKSDRWDYDIPIDKEHPDGVMSEAEYKKFVEYAISETKESVSELMKDQSVETTDDKGEIIFKRGMDLDARQLAPKMKSFSTKATNSAKNKVLSE